MHALVACHRGRIGYEEGCFSLDLFIISSSWFASLILSVLSYSSLPFDHFPIVHSFAKSFI